MNKDNIKIYFEAWWQQYYHKTDISIQMKKHLGVAWREGAGYGNAAIEQAVEADPKRCKICGKEFNYCPYCEKSGAA